MQIKKITTFIRDNRRFFSRGYFVAEAERSRGIYLVLPESRTLVSPRPRYVSNYPYNRKWRQLYTYQVSCYEAPRNGVRHKNGAVNYNASSPRTIMPPQCSFLATMGVALMGVRLQRVPPLKPPSPHDFPVRVNSNRDLFPLLSLSRTDLLDEKKKRYSSLCLQRQDFETRNGQVAEHSQRTPFVLLARNLRVSIAECNP